MAQLHRRIRRVQDHRVGARLAAGGWLLLALWATPVASAQDQAAPQAAAAWINGAPDASDLAALGEQLVAADGNARKQAFETLLGLPTTAVEAIEARFAQLAASPLDEAALVRALTAFRHAVGSTRADDDVDIVPGILATTEHDRAPEVATAAELLLLLRALEAMDTPAAGLALANGLAVNFRALTQESNRIRSRAGANLAPTWIALRGHPNADVRRWASRSLRSLGLSDPTTLTSVQDASRLAAILRAYGTTHDLEAMPTLVSFLNDPRILVRTAARDAVRELGRNAIWKLRIAYQEATGKSANGSWDTARTLTELCEVFDRQRIELAETALARGKTAHLAGDLALMEAQFDKALRIDPLLAKRAEMAPGFAALGAAKLDADDLAAAASAYRRAIRLASDPKAAAPWQAELAFIEAEQALARGIVDMEGYENALALAPAHARASDAIDRLSGAWSERQERRRRMIAIAAIVLLSAFGIGLLRMRRAPVAPVHDPQATPGT